MKKAAVRLLTAFLAAVLFCVPARGEKGGPELYAQAAVLVDALTGQVLYAKNAGKRMEPASLTKIMTCLLAMEQGSPQDTVPVTGEAIQMMEEATSIYLREGEQLSMEQMLYAVMLPSANDAANAVAIHLDGSVFSFVKRMNRRGKELGLEATHFVNASGMPAEGHYSSALDIARITRAALEYPEFLDYAGSARYSVPATGQSPARNMAHLNRLLRPDSEYYDERAIAGKTGWTESAGNCLMTVAEEGGVRLIAVVLHSEGAAGAAYQDTGMLLDYGFSAFQRSSIFLEEVSFPLEAKGECAVGGGDYLPVLIPRGSSAAELEARVVLPEGAAGENGAPRGRVRLYRRGTEEEIGDGGELLLQVMRGEEPVPVSSPEINKEAKRRADQLFFLLVVVLTATQLNKAKRNQRRDRRFVSEGPGGRRRMRP